MIFFLFFSVSTIDNTAVHTFDYERISGKQLTLTSTLPVCFNVTILEDLFVEGTETFSVQLATSNPRVQIPDRTSSVHIVDDGNYSHIFYRVLRYLQVYNNFAIKNQISGLTNTTNDNCCVCSKNIIPKQLLER